MIEVTSKFHDLIDAMVVLNHKYRDELPPEIESEMGLVGFATSFCTVRCDIGRLVGKTLYIKHRADNKSLVVAPTKKYADRIYGKREFDVLTVRQIAEGEARTKDYSTVYFEDPTYLPKAAAMLDIYEHLVRDGTHQTFIVLGE